MDLEKQLLSEYGNKRPFKVSDGYFDNLSERIMEHISIDSGNVEQTHKKNYKIDTQIKTTSNGSLHHRICISCSSVL